MPDGVISNQNLTDRVDEAAVTAALSEMVAIQSVNPFDEPASPGHRECEMADYLCARMEALGMEVERRDIAQGRPNVCGRLKGTGGGASFMLAGHMDTVGVEGYDGAFEPRVEEGKLYGRGACDMKGALAAYLEVVRVLRDSGTELKGDLLIGVVSDEEHTMIGSKDWGPNWPHADAGVIGEPTELAICPAHKGQAAMLIRTFGKAVHSSMPELGENAIVRMARVIEAFDDYWDELASREPHPLCGHGRFSPGVIQGGTISSAVPDFCELEVDRRMVPGETEEQIVAEYRARLDRLSENDPGFRYEIAGPTIGVGPLDIASDDALVTTLAKACETVTGSAPPVTAFPGGTDAPNMGFPCIICGPGALAQAHTVNEFVETRQLADAARIYLLAALDFTGST